MGLDVEGEVKQLVEEINDLRSKLAIEQARPTTAVTKTVFVPTVQLEYDPEKPLIECLADMQAATKGKLIDMFREWDVNGDGEISRAEFRRALRALGYVHTYIHKLLSA